MFSSKNNSQTVNVTAKNDPNGKLEDFLRPPFTSSVDFLNYLLHSLSRPTPEGVLHQLPRYITQKDLNILVARWNSNNPNQAVSIPQAIFQRHPLSKEGELETQKIIKHLSILSPKDAQKYQIEDPEKFSPFKQTLPSKATYEALNHPHFQRWLKAQIEKGDDTLVKSLAADGLLSKNDLDRLVDHYKSKGLKEADTLLKVSGYYKTKSVETIFPGIKFSQTFPTITPEFLPVAKFFYEKSIGATTDYPKDPKSRARVEVVLEALQARSLGKRLPKRAEESVTAIFRAFNGNSDIVDLRIGYINQEKGDLLKLRKQTEQLKREGEVLIDGIPIDLKLKNIDTRLNRLHQALLELPKGHSQRLLQNAFNNEIISEGGKVLRDALKTFKAEIKPTGFTALDADANYKTKWERYAAIEKYLTDKASKQNGVVTAEQIEIAKKMMAGVGMYHLGGDSVKNALEDPLTWAKKLEESSAIQQKNLEKLNKGIIVGTQVIASAFAALSQQYYAIPAIWGSPITLSSIAKANIEDLSFLDALKKEWKEDGLFGQPSEEITKHLSVDPKQSIALLALDLIAFAGADALAIQGGKLIAKAPIKITGETIKRWAQKRGFTIGDDLGANITSELGRIVEDPDYLTRIIARQQPKVSKQAGSLFPKPHGSKLVVDSIDPEALQASINDARLRVDPSHGEFSLEEMIEFGLVPSVDDIKAGLGIEKGFIKVFKQSLEDALKNSNGKKVLILFDIDDTLITDCHNWRLPQGTAKSALRIAAYDIADLIRKYGDRIEVGFLSTRSAENQVFEATSGALKEFLDRAGKSDAVHISSKGLNENKISVLEDYLKINGNDRSVIWFDDDPIALNAKGKNFQGIYIGGDPKTAEGRLAPYSGIHIPFAATKAP